MKRFLSFALLVILTISLLPVHAYAVKDTQSDKTIIYLDDNSYITVEVSEVESRASGTKTGSKTYRYYNNNVEEWKAVLRGTFSYTGSSATCTASSCDVTISDSAWYTVSKNVSKSGNSANCTLTMGRKFLGITISKETINMTLSCDANGNLS